MVRRGALLVWLGLGATVAGGADIPATSPTYYGSTERIRGFDPITAGDTASAAAIYKLYEGLLEYEYLERPYTVRPLLAEGLPAISADGLTYTFRIKRGVRFHDDPCFPNGQGRELTAEDFVYAWKRVADVRNRSTGYWIFEGRIVGLDEFREQSQQGAVDYNQPVAGVRAPDRYTFQVTLTEPYPQLLWILTMDYAFAVPREAVEYYGAEFLNHPVGTGPFVIHDWQRNYRIEYVKNPTYHGDRYPTNGAPADVAAGLLADAGQPLPRLERVVQYTVGDPSTEWLLFLAGRLASSGISQNNFDAVITLHNELTPELRARGIRLFKTPQMRTDYIGFNMEDPLLGTNRKLRQALSHAFDVQRWIEFYNNRMIPATGPIPPGVAGYDPPRPAPYPFDLARARALLAEAGYPDGRDPQTGRRLELTIDIGSAADPEVRQSVDLTVSFFAAIGIDLQPQYNNWPEFLKKLDRKQVQMYRLAWVIDYPDAENFLQLFYSKNVSPGPNHSNYQNPEFDRLYEQIRTMQDTPARTALYRQMADIVVADAPWIFMTHPLAFGLFQPWLKNFKPHDFPYPNIKYYTIDAAGGGR